MPFPLTFLAGKTFARPTYRNPIPSLADLILSHYAIEGPRNQSTETILQTFDHVTEGTVADPPWLIPCTKFLHFVELIFRFLCVAYFHVLCRQRVRRNLLDTTSLQPQHPVAAAGKRQVMRSNEGGELVLAM